ncbi:VOC family protein [Hymenobacter wooponensis]|uniref:VOC family protein n=1 Tax=Hymenobacter wooponensis TaxID=1525360 RepID=A0A4Z0MJY7_9BACT|nr:VOC family protein [Hymenobacter wooponensis]TGD79617.1 VOC family protein [Hymenobacter wooponensis]
MEDQNNEAAPASPAGALPPKVTGIGGIFFISDNPQATREWYAQHLGLETTDWGATFTSRSADNPDEVTSLQWSPFPRGTNYFAPSTREFMINYRVQNIEALVGQLAASGVTILDGITSHDYGKFVHILDSDGNKLELWEPA